MEAYTTITLSTKDLLLFVVLKFQLCQGIFNDSCQMNEQKSSPKFSNYLHQILLLRNQVKSADFVVSMLPFRMSFFLL